MSKDAVLGNATPQPHLCTTNSKFSAESVGTQTRIGRPPGPYSTRNPVWEEYRPFEQFGCVSHIDHLHPASGTDHSDKSLLKCLIVLLAWTGVPTHRRFLESVLIHRSGFDPARFTKCISGLRLLSMVHRHVLTVGKETHYVYGLRLPLDTELQAIAKLIKLRQQIDANVLGNAGERFVRAALVQSGRFHDITQEERLGQLLDPGGKGSLDIYASTGNHQFAFSVKNESSWLFPKGSTNIDDVWKRAKAHKREPWLVQPFVHASAFNRCRQNRILLTQLGAQILPARINRRDTRALLSELTPIIGPMPFRIITKRIDRIEWANGKNPFATL
jgi:hypothetical protein